MTLRDQIIADTDTVFLNNADFSENVKWFPLGAVGSLQTIKAVVLEDWLEGNFQVPGDGRVLDREMSRQLRESMLIEISISHAITEPTGTNADTDTFEIRGETWYVKRVLARDMGMQAVLLVRAQEFIRRRGEYRG